MDKNWMISDLHIHSKHSRACSKDLNFENLVKWARIKGVNLLGTGDFSHPVWINEIKEKLRFVPAIEFRETQSEGKSVEKDGKGLYYYQDFPFIITGEISLIYTQEHGRKVHLILLIPSIEVAEMINAYLDTKGRRDYDGRPIFKISCENFVKDMMSISKDIEVIPAHIWTPYFGVFGSMGGFDSLKEAFGSQLENVHAIETGISSDPAMNWKIKELWGKSIVSFSDLHSFWPYRLGREATIFKKVDSYAGIIEQIRNNSFIGTIEADPAYGKYHWDGHDACDFSCSPEKTKEINNICPQCKKNLIIGVEHRVADLTNASGKPSNARIFYTLLPLHEIISLAFGVGMQSKKIWNAYTPLIEAFGNEFEILLHISREKLLQAGVSEKLAELIMLNREGKIKVNPGFDGRYGVAVIGNEEKQIALD